MQYERFRPFTVPRISPDRFVTDSEIFWLFKISQTVESVRSLDTFTNVHKKIEAGKFEPERSNALKQIVEIVQKRKNYCS